MKSYTIVSAQEVLAIDVERHTHQSALYGSPLKQLITDLNLTVFWQNTLMHSRLFMDQPAAQRAVENQSILHETPLCLRVRAPQYHCRPPKCVPRPRWWCFSWHQISRPFSQLQSLIWSPVKSMWWNNTKGSRGGGCIYTHEPCTSRLKHALGL